MIHPTANEAPAPFTSAPSQAARARLLSHRGEPFLIAGWHRVLMLHFEVDPQPLQRDVPFTLDLYHGRAFVSLVAFSLQDLRPRWGGPIAQWLFHPIASHHFLNVRTYVQHNGETGIHFLAEWLSNRLATQLGPPLFSLPYRYGKLTYAHDWTRSPIHGEVADETSHNRLIYQSAPLNSPVFQPCQAGSLTEWLMERYTAFNSAGGRPRLFRVWHPPWPQTPISATATDQTLLTRHWPWFADAQMISANFSPGFDQVWMGRPHSTISPPL